MHLLNPPPSVPLPLVCLLRLFHLTLALVTCSIASYVFTEVSSTVMLSFISPTIYLYLTRFQSVLIVFTN